MAHNMPSSNFSNMSTCTKTRKSTEATIKNIVNIPMVGVGLAMEDLMALELRDQFGDVLAELAISAISSGLSVMAKAHVLIVLVSSKCGFCVNSSNAIRIRVRL